MLEERRLSLEEADRVIATAFDASRAAGPRGIAVVVTDKYGEIIAGARMDGLAPRYFKAAHRKSYTAAVFERDTADVMHFWQRQESLGHRGPSDWNDSMFHDAAGRHHRPPRRRHRRRDRGGRGLRGADQ